MHRHARVALAVALTAGAIAVAGTDASAGLSNRTGGRIPPPVRLQVLSFNDFHGHLEPPGGRDANLGFQLDPLLTPVGGAEYLATTLADLRKGDANTTTVAAGDLIGGSPFLSGLFHDEPAVESLNALGLDVSSVGNHEFDEGLTELLRVQNGGCRDDGCYSNRRFPGADWQYLAANVVHEDSGATVLPPTFIQRYDGVPVGFIGMTLEGTPSLVAQAGIRGLEFRDEVATANAAARRLKDRGVEAIVVLLHEGGMQAGTFGECVGISGAIVDIASRLSASIDLVVTGHTHQPYVCNIDDPAGRPRMVTSASSFGRVVTETQLKLSRVTGDVLRRRVVSTNHLVANQTVAPDATQSAIIAKWSALSAPIANRVVGTIASDINRGDGCRCTEGPLGNLIADAQLAATAAPADGGAQIAFMNPGGVRADLTFAEISGGEQPGEVTYGEAFEVQPFGNLLVTMDLTGEQIERLLEQQAIAERTLIFGVSAGFTFTYDGTGEFGERIDPESIMLNGVVLNPSTTYRIATNSFLADGGDAFTIFTEGTNRIGGGDDLAAFTTYLDVNGPVSPPPDRIEGI